MRQFFSPLPSKGKPLVLALCAACCLTAPTLVLAADYTTGNASSGNLTITSSSNITDGVDEQRWIVGWRLDGNEASQEGWGTNAELSIEDVVLKNLESRFVGAVNCNNASAGYNLSDNTVTIVNSSAFTVQAAFASSDADADMILSNNATFVSGKTSGGIYGAFGSYTAGAVGTATASGNKVIFREAVFDNTKFEEEEDNPGIIAPRLLTVFGASLTAYGIPTEGQPRLKAENNQVWIYGSDLSRDPENNIREIAAAYLDSPTATVEAAGNSLTIEESRIKAWRVAAVIADVESFEAFSGNKLRLVNAEIDGPIYGTYSYDGNHPDHGAVIEAAGVNSATTLGGFEALVLEVSAGTNAEEPVLKVTRSLDFEGRTLTVKGAGDESFDPAVTYHLLEVEEGITNLDDSQIKFEDTWTEAEGKLSIADGVVTAGNVTSTAGNEDSKTLAESFLGSIALVNQGAEFIAEEGLSSMNAAAGESAWSAFGAVQGGSTRYDTGSHVDLDGVTLATGVATKWGGTLLAGFVEAGWGSSESHVRASKADGDHDYYGLGAALRHAVTDAVYVDASLRAGWASTEFDGLYADHSAKYDSDGFYGSAHVGAGYLRKLTPELTADLYGRYTVTVLEGDDALLSDTAKFNMSSSTTHAFRVGARLTGSCGEASAWRAGLAYEHVADGDAESTVNGTALAVPSLEGDAAIAELGWRTKPSSTSPWAFDLGIKGYAGDREGVTGNAQVIYTF